MAKTYNEADLVLAVQAIQNNPKLSKRRAAKTYEVPESTLRARLSGRLSRRDTQPNSRIMTNLEEEVIVKHILDLDARAFPPRIADVEAMANSLCATRNAPPVGTRWASRFVARRLELKTRWNRPYDYQRAQCEDPKLIVDWFRLVANIIAKYGIQEEDIYNFDETGFMMGKISTNMVVTSSERHARPKTM